MMSPRSLRNVQRRLAHNVVWEWRERVLHTVQKRMKLLAALLFWEQGGCRNVRYRPVHGAPYPQPPCLWQCTRLQISVPLPPVRQSSMVAIKAESCLWDITI